MQADLVAIHLSAMIRNMTSCDRLSRSSRASSPSNHAHHHTAELQQSCLAAGRDGQIATKSYNEVLALSRAYEDFVDRLLR